MISKTKIMANLALDVYTRAHAACFNRRAPGELEASQEWQRLGKAFNALSRAEARHCRRSYYATHDGIRVQL